WNSLLFRLSLIFAVLLIGTFVSGIVEKRSGERDPSFIVIDEVVGIWLTLALLPTITFPENIGRIIFAFLAFRFFDILKVPPIKKLESIHGGLGIMLDDIMAGIYAGTLVNIFTLVF
ncbi:MAG: phosphatidylglycerophosphatase A, partial [Candidatus Marinimicrobia bacterium]|nr:phosphatidylglycerophosphatase A [Candidatus Neomarinimicrobiota bacterium]